MPLLTPIHSVSKTAGQREMHNNKKFMKTEKPPRKQRDEASLYVHKVFYMSVNTHEYSDINEKCITTGGIQINTAAFW